MKKSLFHIYIAVMTLLVSCQTEPVPEKRNGNGPADAAITDSGNEYITVLFSDEMAQMIEADLADGGIVTRSSEFNDAMGILGVKSMTRVFPHAGEYEKRTRAEGLHKWYVVEYEPSYVVSKGVEAFISIPGIEYAELECEPQANSLDIFNDPYLYQQWHYYNDGTYNEYCVAGADINVLPVWENYTVGSDKVIVAVVDGGIDRNHEDLKDNFMGGKNYAQENTQVSAHGHGTHTSGTIAAVNNNGVGVCGIAGGDKAKGIKGVRLWSAQILSDYGNATSSRCATAVKEGADYGAVISQNSWSINGPNKSIEAAIDYFIKYAGCDNEGNQRPDSPMKGGVVIFSSGNDGKDTGYPGGYEPTIAVAAVSCDNSPSSYSCYGDWVDICAPGGGQSGYDVLSTIPGNQYIAWWGTSMSCPHVSGVAALLVSYFGGPGFTNEMLEEKLIKGANQDPVTIAAQRGPRLDALGSFMYGNMAPEAVPSADVVVSKNKAEVRFKVTASEGKSGKAFGYTVVASKDREVLKGLDYRNLPSTVVSVLGMTADKEVGADMSLLLEGLEHGTTYYVAVVGYDCYRTYSALSPIYEVTTEGNRAPLIIAGQEGGIHELWVNETLKLVYRISDSDGDEFRVDFESGSEAAVCRNNLSGECIVTIKGYDAAPGSYEAKITATDEFGAASTEVIKYEIR